MNYTKQTIITNQRLIGDIFLLRVTRPEGEIRPGQFFMLKSWNEELTLMRPISVYRHDEQSVSFMYRVAGKGTRWLSETGQMDRNSDIMLLGPLGNGFPCEEVHGHIALVGGGIGIPPLYETAKRLTDLGNQVDVYLGYKDVLFAFEEFENVCENIFISSEKGFEGYKGFITDLLKPEQYDAVFTCGPLVMMRKIVEMCKQSDTPLWCSMEKHMGCGIGACLTCSCKTTNGMKRTCKDGPVFKGEELVF
ncbi:MAG: dihydroorotate dehydrogenase electron transfer subunit [Bacteroidales bacterium]|nr:dihydroorotate dehydrogenase electron transfer subunit [Bacteroidales bacterium]